jgi:hypothetical protein
VKPQIERGQFNAETLRPHSKRYPPNLLRLTSHRAGGSLAVSQAGRRSNQQHEPMNIMQRVLKSIIPLAASFTLLLGVTALAEDKPADVNGTWKSSFTNQNSQVRETTFKLKAEGDKLTGTVSGRNNDTAIEDGKIKGDEISFKVTREINGNKVVIKYNGKVSGDTIKGKSESQRDGQPQSRDWVAKKQPTGK